MTSLCIDIGNYIINRVNEYNCGKPLKEQVLLSTKRLQKILFFGNVLYMVEHNGISMFEDEFYVWPSGPVIPSVYRKFMMYQDGPMRPSHESNNMVSTEIKDVLDRVLEDTQRVGTNVLIQKSLEQGNPCWEIWKENSNEEGSAIDNKLVYAYYLTHNVPYGAKK